MLYLTNALRKQYDDFRRGWVKPTFEATRHGDNLLTIARCRDDGLYYGALRLTGEAGVWELDPNINMLSEVINVCVRSKPRIAFIDDEVVIRFSLVCSNPQGGLMATYTIREPSEDFHARSEAPSLKMEYFNGTDGENGPRALRPWVFIVD